MTSALPPGGCDRIQRIGRSGKALNAAVLSALMLSLHGGSIRAYLAHADDARQSRPVEKAQAAVELGLERVRQQSEAVSGASPNGPGASS